VFARGVGLGLRLGKCLVVAKKREFNFCRSRMHNNAFIRLCEQHLVVREHRSVGENRLVRGITIRGWD
jgi:hypothetical protein